MPHSFLITIPTPTSGTLQHRRDGLAHLRTVNKLPLTYQTLTAEQAAKPAFTMMMSMPALALIPRLHTVYATSTAYTSTYFTTHINSENPKAQAN